MQISPGSAQLEAEQHRELLETFFRHSPAGFAVVDTEFRYVRLNDLLAEMNGLPVAEQLGLTVSEVLPTLWPQLEPLYQRALGGETVTGQMVSGLRSGSSSEMCHRLISCFPVRVEGVITGVGGMSIDITDRERDRNALRVRTDLYSMMSRTSRAVVERRSASELYADICQIAVETGHFQCAWIGVPDGDRLRLVASAGEDNQYARSVVISIVEADPRSHGPTGRAVMTGDACIVNDFMTSSMTSLWHPQAKHAGFASSAAFPFKEHGTVAAVLSLYSNQEGFFTPDLVDTLYEITPIVSFALDAFVRERDRVRDDAELRLRDRAIRAVSQGICITDPRQPDNPMVFISPAFERMTGYSSADALGRNSRFLQGPETDTTVTAELRDAIRERRGCTVDILNYRKDGTPFWNELTIAPVVDEQGVLTHFVGVQADVTERRRLEHHLRQAQKMEAVGQLASGVAHDFNNLLTVIGGCSELLLDVLAPNDPSRELVLDIRHAGERGSTLTAQLLLFSRKQVVTQVVLDLNAAVSASDKLLRRVIGEDIMLRTQVSEHIWPVKADAGHIEQILINLAVNGRDAMPNGGSLTVATANLTTEAQNGIPAGEYVVLDVVDTGSGMDERTRKQIFEPFFTTKLPGKGTGLGLATVRSIVDQSHGFIAVESAPGTGTRFRIYFPREHSATELIEAPRKLFTIPRGTETVLLVEDDPAVRALGARILRRSGYTVIEATDGGDALSVSRAHHGVIHLLLSDVVMPRLGGRLLAEALLAERPECRVLFLSGYPDDDVLRHGIIGSEVAFLQKPYTPLSLAQKVRAVLDAAVAQWVLHA